MISVCYIKRAENHLFTNSSHLPETHNEVTHNEVNHEIEDIVAHL